MNKKLLTVWVAWLLTLWPNANAGINSTKLDTNKDLNEVLAKEQTTSEDSTSTITFEEAKKLAEQKELYERIINNKEILEIIKEHWEEEVKKVIIELLTNEGTQTIIDDALKNEDIQKALEEWNQEELQKLIEEVIADFHHDRPWRWRVLDKLWFWVIMIFLREQLKKNNYL